MRISSVIMARISYMKAIKVILTALLVILSVIGVYHLYKTLSIDLSKKEVEATVLLERVEKVVKLVSIEGHFSEIYDYKHHLIADIWPFRKKALVRVNAKVLVGYDFENMTINTDESQKTLHILQIPPPEILSIEHDLDYYNFENGLFNMISNQDITAMGFEAKEFIRQKASESDLFAKAEDQRREIFDILRLSIEATGWELIVDEATLTN